MSDYDQIRDLYDVCAANYDKHMEKTGHYLAQEKVLAALIDYFREPILEVACGTGFLTTILEKKFKTVCANDFCQEMIHLARHNVPDKNTTFTSDNAEILPSYAEKKFGTIFDCNLFFYLRNYPAALKRWDELLGDGGRIIIMEEYPFIKPHSFELDPYSQKLMELIKPLSPEKIVAKMAAAGFKETKKVQSEIDDKHDLYGFVFERKIEVLAKKQF